MALLASNLGLDRSVHERQQDRRARIDRGKRVGMRKRQVGKD